MATVNLDIALKMLENDGVYPGDPKAYSIWRYENQFNGDHAYSICYDSSAERSLLMSDACRNKVKLWDRGFGLTLTGREYLDKGGKDGEPGTNR